MIQILFRIWLCLLKQSCREFHGEQFFFLLQPLKSFVKASKVHLKLFGEKKFKKKLEKGKGGASRPRPHFWPAGRSRPSPPALSPSTPPRSRPRRVRARTAAPRRRGEPAELGCRVASMRSPGRALVSHQERPAAPASAIAAICARQLSLSRPRSARTERRRRHWSLSSASAVLPQRVCHSSIRSPPSFAHAPPLQNTRPSVR